MTNVTIPQIINELNEENGSNYKMDVLKKYKNNTLLQKVLKMTYDKVSHNFGISMKNISEINKHNDDMSLETALKIIEEEFVTRNETGNAARDHLHSILISLSKENADIVTKIINRDLRINMGRSNINKVFKNLIVKPPYMRCGIYNEKTAKKINFPAMVQVKCDGMFQAVTVDQKQVTFTSRSGEERELPELEKHFKNFEDGVYIGELLVHGLDNRSESNGIINSDNPENVYIQLWDYITLEEYSRPKNKTNKTFYIDRFNQLEKIVKQSKDVMIVQTQTVTNIQEALKYTQKWMNEGQEGSILKDSKNIFVDHTSPTQLKLKLVIDAEVRVIGFQEGKKGTKREETFGAMIFENDEGTIKGRTSGFTDKQLEDFNSRRDELIGKVMTVEFNDVTKGRDNEHYALSHPRFVEFRNDKNTTDTLERVLEMKEMAMNLS